MNPKVATSMMDFDDPMQFWSIFAAAMNENPPPQSEIDTVLPQFKYLGIEFGKPLEPEGRQPDLSRRDEEGRAGHRPDGGRVHAARRPAEERLDHPAGQYRRRRPRLHVALRRRDLRTDREHADPGVYYPGPAGRP